MLNKERHQELANKAKEQRTKDVEELIRCFNAFYSTAEGNKALKAILAHCEKLSKHEGYTLGCLSVSNYIMRQLLNLK